MPSPRLFGYLLSVFLLVIHPLVVNASEVEHTNQLSTLGLPNKLVVSIYDQHWSLYRVGESERSFLFFDVYNVGYYEKRAQDSESPIKGVLHLVYERDLGKDKLHKALRKGVKKNLSNDERLIVSSELDLLLESIDSDVKKDDILSIVKTEDNKLLFIYNETLVSTVTNRLLVKALWGIWLGENSVVDRESLTAGK